MANYNLNISTLFSSLNTNSNNIFSSINLSDYQAIKNGSYGKLMKSYYTEQMSSNVKTDSDSTTVNKKNQSTDTTGMTKMKKEADGLQSAVETLGSADLWKQTSGGYDVDKIVGAVKDFTAEYNSVLEQSAKVITNNNVSSSVGYMKSLSSTMSKALSGIGIQVGVDGKMTVDEETLKSAKMSSAKSLFSGVSSYGYQIEKYAGNISKEALMSSSIYNDAGLATSTLAGMFDGSI